METAIRVWHIPLSVTATHAAWDLLDANERTKAERFVRDVDRNRYVGAHAGMRRILAAETGSRPTDLHFAVAAEGKPFLVGSALRFNLSHTGDHAVLAVSAGADVGIDIETTAPNADHIAHLVLSDRELAAYRRLAPSERETAFLRVWTRKEALLKAIGCGLLRDPRSVTVGVGELAADGSAAVELDGTIWHLRDFAIAPRTAGCVAANSQIPPISILSIED
jgi:4'-phosphopantetheinyl transferase